MSINSQDVYLRPPRLMSLSVCASLSVYIYILIYILKHMYVHTYIHVYVTVRTWSCQETLWDVCPLLIQRKDSQ